MASGERLHPAQKAMHVWRSQIKPTSTEMRSVPQDGTKRKSFLSADAPEARVFRRLVDSCLLFKDPAGQVIYPGLKQLREKQEAKEEKVIAPKNSIANVPISVPTCCTSQKEPVKEQVGRCRRYLHHSPTRALPDIIAHRAQDRKEKLAKKNLRINERRQLPLSTVVVRWRNIGRLSTVRAYDTETLYEMLSAFGPVLAIYTTSPCSAYVVFANLKDGCEVIESRTLGRPDNRLYCFWLHKNMTNKLFYLSTKGVLVQHNDFIQPSR